MSDLIKFTFDAVPNAYITIHQGTTYYNRWELTYEGEVFPFYNGNNELLWDISFSIRDSFLDSPNYVDPYLFGNSITSANGLISGAFIEQEEDSYGVNHTYYGMYLISNDTLSLPSKLLWYNIKIKRIEDDWSTRIQEGICKVTPDIKIEWE